MRLFFFAFFIFLIIGCLKEKCKIPLQTQYSFFFEPKRLQSKRGINNGMKEVELIYGKEQISENWEEYRSTDDQIEITVPSSWEVGISEICVFVARPDNDSLSLFSFSAFNKEEYDLNIHSYLNTLAEAMEEDSVEFMVRGNIEAVIPEKEYFGQFETTMDSIDFMIFSYFMEDKENVLDLTLKVRKDEFWEYDHMRFLYVLNSLLVNDYKLIEPSSERNSWGFNFGYQQSR